jgi:hypothetical protein
MLQDFKLGQTSIVLRVLIRNANSATWGGLTGLTNTSSGLIIGTIADNESSATVYTSAASTIDTIATLGTFAAPASGHCRFGKVDDTNLPGVCELQLDNSRYAVSGAKSLTVCISGPTSASQCTFTIPLRQIDPYDGQRAGLTALPAASAASAGGLLTSGSGANQLATSSGAVTLASGQAGTIASAVWTDTTSGDFSTAGSPGLAIISNLSGVKAQTDKLAFDAGGNVLANAQATAATLVFNLTGNLSGSVGSVSSAVTVGANNDKSGYSLSGAGISAVQSGLATSSSQSAISGTLGTPAGASVSADIAAVKSDTAKIGTNSADSPNQQTSQSTIATNLDAKISSRSTYGGADTAGTTTLLTRVSQAIPFATDGSLKSEQQGNVTVGGYASGQSPPTTSQIASAILRFPANLLWTDSNGDVNAVGGVTDSGPGLVGVNHDTGGTDSLRYVDSTGAGVADATILVYLASDWPGQPGRVQARSSTGADGRWIIPAFVEPGTYVAVFARVGCDGPDVSAAFTV